MSGEKKKNPTPFGKMFRGSLKNRTKGTKDNPLTAYEKQIIKKKAEDKQKTKNATFFVKAGQFGKGNLSGIAQELGLTLKSLEKDNPKIANLNKIKDGQNIKVPVRKKTFFEKYIAGTKNSPTVVKNIRTTDKPRKEVVYKKGVKGPVYKGMSQADMKKLQMKKRGGKISGKSK
tara:strand:- start:6 stop:527 length:522 start_codon:yes stop_codon:yes gene_type:complete